MTPVPFFWVVLAPIAAVEYLKAARSFAGDHRLGVAIAQLDLTDRPACSVKLAENYRRAVSSALRRPAGALITASANLNGRHRRIEVRFEHRLVSITRVETSELTIRPTEKARRDGNGKGAIQEQKEARGVATRRRGEQ